MKKIKILFAINYLTNGGPTRVLQNIIYGINKKKYDIKVMTLFNINNDDIVKELEKMGVEIISLNYKKSIKSLLVNLKKIVEIIDSVNADIIHVNGIILSYIIGNDKIKSKKVTTIHNNMYDDYKYSYGIIKGKLIELAHIKWLKKFNINICCSKTAYNYLSKKIKNVTWIRNGINVKHNKNARALIRNELGLNDSDIAYIYGGVINKRKRVVELIKLFENNHSKNEFLLIVGDGPQLEEAKKTNDKNIIFTGFKTNIIDYFDASDIYVSNSSAEGFSISVIEAIGSGLLCLLSDIDSHKECFNITDSVYIGESFSPNNFKESKDKVKSHIKSVSKNDLEEFQKKYLSSDCMAKLYCQVYEKVVKE